MNEASRRSLHVLDFDLVRTLESAGSRGWAVLSSAASGDLGSSFGWAPNMANARQGVWRTDPENALPGADMEVGP